MQHEKDVLVIPEFLSEPERQNLRDTAIEYRNTGVLEANPGGPKRFRKKIYGTSYCNDQIHAVAARIIEELSLQPYQVDPYLGWIISYIEAGGFIKPHIDAHEHYRATTDRHLRCNVLVQCEHDSAYPVIDGERIRLGERSLWAFFASEHMHGTNIIRGNIPRVVYQFGFTVRHDYELPGSDTDGINACR